MASSSKLTADISAIQSRFNVLKKIEFRGETTLVVERDAIFEICKLAKEELGYIFLLDISGIDNFGEEPRFELAYELYHFERGEHLRLKISVSEDLLEAPSVTSIWATADWHEREAYDMYGIKFAGHPDLRRILMWDGYPYHPLRKDFPLAGRPSEMPDVAFSKSAPLEGGPFVTVPSTATTKDREPRSRQLE